MISENIQRLLLILFGFTLSLMMILVALQNPLVQNSLELFIYPCQPAPGNWQTNIRAAIGDIIDLLPCARFYHKNSPNAEFHNRVRYNNYGFHDTNWSLKKPDGVYRILLLGDSFAQGNEIPMQDGFPFLLETALNQANPSQPVEIINAGLQTLSTGGELGLYSTFGWQFEPDLVILVFYVGNDIWDNYFGFPQIGINDNDVLVVNPAGLVMQLDPALYPESAAYQWFMEAQIEGLVNPPDMPVTPPNYPSEELRLYLPETPPWRRAREVTERLLLQLRDLVHAQGSEFAVIIMPDRRAVYREYLGVTIGYFPEWGTQLDITGMHTYYTNFLTENQIPTLNLQPIFTQWAGNHPEDHLYFRIDGHQNTLGHQLTAQIIEHWLLQTGLP